VKRDLYVSTFAPTLGTGRALRTYTCIKALAMLGPVDLAYIPHEGDEPSPEYQAIEGLEFHRVSPSRGLRRAGFYASKRARGIPQAFARGASPELVDEAQRLIEHPRRGRIVVGDLNASTALMPLMSRHAITYNAHNVVSAYNSPQLSDRPLPRLAARAYERKLLRRAVESWMVSRADLEAAAELVPGARLRYVPNVADVAEIVPAQAHPPGGRLLMVGDFLYEPNRVGRSFLVDEVLPRVWQVAPETRVTLVGRGLNDWPAPDPRIEVAGFVDDLAAVYYQSDCVVVPITVGGGTPLKFIEALAYRVPIVATPFAARGLEVRAGEHYLEGTDAESFARAVVEVLRDGAVQVAAQARALAEAEYSVQALAQLIAERSPQNL
jgi:polysaccharide biosynthesis protein PslH